jgi:excisionase family DNA binding protein
MGSQELMTKAEVMEFLRISKGTLDKLMRRREIRFHKLERKTLFRRSDVEKFLKSKLVK